MSVEGVQQVASPIRRDTSDEKLAIAERLVSGDLSSKEYFAAIGEDRRRHGDIRLLLDILTIQTPEGWGEELPDYDPDRITHRELEVLKALAEGMRHDEIAAETGMGGETVKTHLKNTYRKLGARNAPHAVACAIRMGLISVE